MTESTETLFNGLEHHLEKNIYLTPKGLIRLNILWKDLLQAIPDLREKPAKILDIGGGAGHIARELACLGHHVVLSDASKIMLQFAEKENDKINYSGKIELLHSSIDELPVKLNETYDLVLIHGVLEWLENPKSAFLLAADFITKGKYLSVLFYNIDRLILKCGIHGQFRRIKTGTYTQMGKKRKLTPVNPLNQNDVKEWIEEKGLNVISKAGIRIFYDLFRNDEGFNDRLKELQAAEETYSGKEPYASIAQHIHFVCRN